MKKLGDELKLKPTPIQRNALDVAMELTQLYYSRKPFEGREDIAETFVNFYAAAELGKSASYSNLAEFLSDKLKKLHK